MPGVAWIALLLASQVLRPGDAAEGGTGRRLPSLSLSVLVYGATMLAAFALSPATDLGLPILRSTISGILLFLVAATALRSWSHLGDALVGLSAAALLVGGVACLEHVTGASSGVGFVTSTGALVNRVTAGFGHPNQLGGFLVVLIPISFAAAVIDRRWRIVHLVGVIMGVGGVYASFSRGALLALAIMPLLLLRGRWLLLLAPVAVVGLSVGVPSVMAERFELGDRDGAQIAGRTDIWSTAAAIWLERPLLGAGLGSFPGTYATVRVSGKQFLPDTRFSPPPHAHNLELQLLAEQGLVGLTAFGFVAVKAGQSARRLSRERHRAAAALGSGLLAMLVGTLVHNLFDVTLLENTGVQFWGALGLLSAVEALVEGGADAA